MLGSKPAKLAESLNEVAADDWVVGLLTWRRSKREQRLNTKLAGFVMNDGVAKRRGDASTHHEGFITLAGKIIKEEKKGRGG